MVNYTNFRNLAERLIEENGRTVTLVRRDQGNPTDPAMPWRSSTEVSEITVDVLAVVIPFEKENVDGDLVRRGDKQFFIADKSVVDESSGSANLNIEDYDAILDGGVRWKILEVELINPGPLRIMYQVQARQ